MANNIYIFDTSVYLSDASCLFKFDNTDVVIPLKVLDEIDNHKKRQDSVGVQARKIIRTLDALREEGNLSKGVKVQKNKGLLTVKGYNPFTLPDDLDLEDSDNQIIATALTAIQENPKKRVVLVTRDINMRVKCDSLNIETEDYNFEQVVDRAEGLYSGVRTIAATDAEIDDVYANRQADTGKEKYYPNECVILSDEITQKKSALTCYNKSKRSLVVCKNFSESIWGIRPRNREQVLALNLLMDDEIPVVSLVGKAGCGKTLLALAAGLEQTIGKSQKYRKILVTKPVEPVGKDIGFLPGTLEEKMLPWLAPIQDNLQFLLGDDRMTLDMYMDNGKIEVEAMTYIRGRSIAGAFIIIDEAQNMNQHEIKTILTRVGEGTKVVLTGDVEQIDNVYVDATNNGLSYVVEKLKDQELAGHITLVKGERSAVASMAAKIL